MRRDPALPERRFSAARDLRSIAKVGSGVVARKAVQKRKARPKPLRGIPEPRPSTAEHLARAAQLEAEIARDEAARAWLREIWPTVQEIKTRLEALDEETASNVLLCDRDWLCEHLGDLLDTCQWASEDVVQKASNDARNESTKDSVLAKAVTELVEDLPVRLTSEAKREFASRLAPLERMYCIRKTMKIPSERARGRRADIALRRLVSGLIGVYADFTDKNPEPV